MRWWLHYKSRPFYNPRFWFKFATGGWDIIFTDNFESWWSGTHSLVNDTFESWWGATNTLINETFEEGWS